MQRLIEGYKALKSYSASASELWFNDVDDVEIAKLAENEAHSLLKSDTEEYYRVSMLQKTVLPLDSKTKYEDILNEKGLDLFLRTQDLFNDGRIKDTFVMYCHEKLDSGCWFKSPTSKFNKPDDPNGIIHCLDNRCISGMLTGGEYVSTSRCVFITDKWCLTASGSIYALKDRLTYLDMICYRKTNK